MKRDFTYIDDIVDGIYGSIKSNVKSLHKIYNLGNNCSEDLVDFVQVIEKSLGIKARKNFLPHQMGDVKQTFADIDESKKDLNFIPKTSVHEGIPMFVEWYKNYYSVQ